MYDRSKASHRATGVVSSGRVRKSESLKVTPSYFCKRRVEESSSHCTKSVNMVAALTLRLNAFPTVVIRIAA